MHFSSLGAAVSSQHLVTYWGSLKDCLLHKSPNQSRYCYHYYYIVISYIELLSLSGFVTPACAGVGVASHLGSAAGVPSFEASPAAAMVPSFTASVAFPPLATFLQVTGGGGKGSHAIWKQRIKMVISLFLLAKSSSLPSLCSGGLG